MEQKVIVITGASDGIGAEAAKMLAAQGHRVVIVGRNPQKTENIAKEIRCNFYLADYARLDDVVNLANRLKIDHPHIDVLVNNAGAMLNERKVTADGFEQTFQINVLAPFLLTYLLLDNLCQSNATVVQTSSIASNVFGRSFCVDDLQNQDYSPTKAYGRAKLCNVLFTRELHRRFGESGICAVAFQPGIPRTNFACESSPFFKFCYHSPLKYLFTTPKKNSAKRIVYFATAKPNVDFVSGETYTFKRKYKIKYKDKDGAISRSLWEQCEKLLGNHIR